MTKKRTLTKMLSDHMKQLGKKGGRESARRRWKDKTEEERREIMQRVTDARMAKRREEADGNGSV